jgi:hypothetical protein
MNLCFVADNPACRQYYNTESTDVVRAHCISEKSIQSPTMAPPGEASHKAGKAAIHTLCGRKIVDWEIGANPSSRTWVTCAAFATCGHCAMLITFARFNKVPLYGTTFTEVIRDRIQKVMAQCAK